MEYRPLTDADAPAWWDLRLEALESEPLAFGQSVEEHRTLSLETVAERFRQPHEKSFTVGAFDTGRMVGMSTFVRESALKRRHIGNIYAVYVSAAHRGRGVAGAILRLLIEIASTVSGLEQLQLAVTTAQPAAKRLYVAAGFRTYGVEPHGLKVGETYVDHEHMILHLRDTA